MASSDQESAVSDPNVPRDDQDRAEMLAELGKMDVRQLRTAVRVGKHSRPSILGVQERMDLEDRIQVLEAQRDGKVNKLPARLAQHLDPGNRSPAGRINSQLNRLRRMLDNGSPDSISPYNKVSLEKELALETEWLKKHMVSRKGTDLRPSPNPEFRKAVTLMSKSENSKEYTEHAMRYKQLQRQLNPDDPDAENLENIRPES